MTSSKVDWVIHRTLDFEMADKIPVTTVLSFWCIKRDCYPSFIPCQRVSLLKRSKCIFFKEK